jgi:hypothetical protein
MREHWKEILIAVVAILLGLYFFVVPQLTTPSVPFVYPPPDPQP